MAFYKVIIAALLAFFLLLTLTSSPSHGASLIRKRNVDNETIECEGNSPCGWAVYTPFKRTIDYFLKNNCECPSDKHCVRVDDDLSVSAYVYRCRTPKSDSTNTNSS